MLEKEPAGVVRGDPDRTRKLILEAALLEFSEKGLGGSRIDTIAQSAGVNKQALYYHFGNKEDLFRATLEYGYRKIREFEKALASSSTDPEESMAGVIMAFFDAINNNRHVGALVTEENRLRGRHLFKSREAQDLTSPFVEQVRKIYSEGVDRKIFRSGIDPEQLWITIVSMVQLYFTNMYSLSHILNKNLDEDEMLRRRRKHVVEFILSAILAERSTEAPQRS
jgi:TetR/AcrR family transcriptional regulator